MSSQTIKISQHVKKTVVLIVIIFLLIGVFSIAAPSFLTLRTFMNLIVQTSSILVIGLGMTFIIITGNIDLSVGAVLAVSGVASAMVVSSFPMNSPTGAFLGFLTALATGALFGLFNGFMVGVCKVNAFMTTLGTMSLARGLALVLCGDARVIVENDFYNYLAHGKFGVMPSVIVLLILLAVCAYIILSKLSFGRKIYAVGGNPLASRIMGISPAKQIMLIYMLSGMLCGLAAIITVGRSYSAQPLVGINLEFEIITAVVLGGTSLMGGMGTVGGTVLGCLLIGIISSGLGMLNVPVFFNYLLKGALILAAVYMDIFTSRRVQKSSIKKSKRMKNAFEAGRRQIDNREFKNLELKGITKSFPGVCALDNVSLRIERGKVHALVGENGAGKSTLMKILAGVYTKDSGEILLDGSLVDIKTPMDSQDLGISVIFQELELVPDLPVYSNIFLGNESCGKSRIMFDIRSMKKKSEELLQRFGLNLNVNAFTKKYTMGQRQMIEIVKSMKDQLTVLIMDEPTASITNADKDILFDTIRNLKAQGVAIVYISHRMQEIFEIADEVTVLRDGKHIVTKPINEMNENALVKYMVNRDLTNLYGRNHLNHGAPVLEVRNLSKKGIFENISFTLHKGEILGFSGLIGAGRSEVMRAIFGIDKYDSGEILLDGRPLRVRNAKESIDSGIAFLTEDRRGEGIVPLMSVGDNISLPILDRVSRLGWVDKKRAGIVAEEYKNKFNIRTPDLQQSIGNLSGGNQQKCCLAKWLATNPKVIILDEPTKGVDIGAKEEIHNIIHQLVENGIAVIIISSELPEVIGASDNIIVMYEGKISGRYNYKRDNITQDLLMASAAGITK